MQRYDLGPLFVMANNVYGEGGLCVELEANEWARALEALKGIVRHPDYLGPAELYSVPNWLTDGRPNFIFQFMVIVPRAETLH